MNFQSSGEIYLLEFIQREWRTVWLNARHEEILQFIFRRRCVKINKIKSAVPHTLLNKKSTCTMAGLRSVSPEHGQPNQRRWCYVGMPGRRGPTESLKLLGAWMPGSQSFRTRRLISGSCALGCLAGEKKTNRLLMLINGISWVFLQGPLNNYFNVVSFLPRCESQVKRHSFFRYFYKSTGNTNSVLI